MLGHDRTLNELSTDPWIVVLAIITLLAILFFLSVTSVQAGLPGIEAARTNVTMPANHNSVLPSQQIWYGDITDISNERAGNVPAAEQKGGASVQHPRENAFGHFMDFLKSFTSGGAANSNPAQNQHL